MVLAWTSLINTLALGVITYIALPFLMVCRDCFLWWMINKVIVNKKVRNIISEYALDKSWLDCADVLPFRVFGSGREQKFYLNKKEVDADMQG